jgi:aminodeoxyfutalosine deaminase
MRRISANYVYPISGTPIRNGIVVLDNNNLLVDVIDPKGKAEELASMEFYNGVIVPGFINVHCHLELSHLKERFYQFNGIAGFVSQVREFREVEITEIEGSIEQAISTLQNNGTVAVGDICNTSNTLKSKSKSKIYYHNFIELFGLNTIDTEGKINTALGLFNSFKLSGKDSVSLTPHSTYSISEPLWNLINAELVRNSSIVSIHYGESKQEYELLSNNSGLLAENLSKLGVSLNIPECSCPLDVVKRFIPKSSKVLFVHNTFSTNDEVQELIHHFDDPYFALCPTSNLFIEGKLPNVTMLAELGATITIGTDSLASSNTLSVLDQVLVLLKEYPSISFEQALKWATLNGAKALDVDSKFGSFEIGKTPGVNLITDFDFRLMKPTTKSRVKRLV